MINKVADVDVFAWHLYFGNRLPYDEYPKCTLIIVEYVVPWSLLRKGNWNNNAGVCFICNDIQAYSVRVI